MTTSAEHYNMILRLLEQNIPVKLRVNVQTKFYDADRRSLMMPRRRTGRCRAL
jgi:hypothetical protein